MLTVDNITSLCPVSERPWYLVFERIIPRPSMDDQTPFWATTAMTNDRDGALEWANAETERDVFVCELTYREASAIRRGHLTFNDVEVARYRNPYPVAAE